MSRYSDTTDRENETFCIYLNKIIHLTSMAYRNKYWSLFYTRSDEIIEDVYENKKGKNVSLSKCIGHTCTLKI